MTGVVITVHCFDQPLEGTVKCKKCNQYSGDDWSQCHGECPMKGSPHYDSLCAGSYVTLSPA